MPIKWDHKFQVKTDRWVFVPTDEGRIRGRKIAQIISQRWTPPDFYYHLRDGGHVAALKEHANNTFFLSLDLENFFGSIGLTRITRHLVPFFGYARARSIAKESTVHHPNDRSKTILPYGFPQSPILASLALSQSALGKYLLHISKTMTVTVYMDDIQISSDNKNDLIKVKEDVEIYARSSNFVLSSEKTQGPAQKITAFNVDLANQSLQITKKRMAEFAVHLSNSPSQHSRRGVLSYIGTVNTSQPFDLINMGL